SSGVQVEFRGAAEVADELLAMLAAGGPPDVVVLTKSHWLGELAGAGALVPLGTETATIVRENYSSGWQELASDAGTLYGVPLDATSKSLVWYRPSALADLDLEPPETWDEWQELNSSLEAAGLTPLAVPGGEGWPLTDWFENVLLQSAGRENYLKLARRQLPWTAPRARQSLERLGDVLRDDWLAGGPRAAASAPMAETVTAAFDPRRPQAVMLLGAGWIGPFARSKHPGLVLGRDLDFFPFPAIEPAYEGSVEASTNIAVALNARPEVTALLSYLASADAGRRWVRGGRVVSPNQAVPLSAYPDALRRREAEHLMRADAIVPDLSDTVPSDLSAALGRELQRFLVEPDTIEAILAELEGVAYRTQGSVR
ncbi:MAG TPA: ABC transporter substrate-binding protein, partial [Ardenticatenaceae bacterium]|nr:ABC transporter substrate-binding protein [Ardenticatenaceae bacterium]